jgi:hypothetical protein
LWASAYERAATAWALTASSGQFFGISFETTPRTYESSGTELTTERLLPFAATTRSPRHGCASQSGVAPGTNRSGPGSASEVAPGASFTFSAGVSG